MSKLFSRVTHSSILTDAALLILRLTTGLVLAFGHGIGKVPPSARFAEGLGEMGLPIPTFFAWCSGLAEFGCGLLLAAGLLTRIASAFIAINMIVVVFVAHSGLILSEGETGFLYLIAALFFLMVGAGRFSLDQVLGD